MTGTRDVSLLSANLKVGPDGQLDIDGTIRNVSAAQIVRVLATFELYDNEGVPLGNTMIHIENIQAGASTPFSSPVDARTCGFRLMGFQKDTASNRQM